MNTTLRLVQENITSITLYFNDSDWSWDCSAVLGGSEMCRNINNVVNLDAVGSALGGNGVAELWMDLAAGPPVLGPTN